MRQRSMTVGSAKVRPDAPIAHPRVNRASLTFRAGGRHHQHLIRQTKSLEPVRTAVVHPVDADSLLGAIEAAKAHLIIPVLVGPVSKIRAAANQAKIDISVYELVPTEHSHAAAAQAVELACDHEVEALMKGSLHTDEFMGPIVREDKRTGSKPLSEGASYEHRRYHRSN